MAVPPVLNNEQAMPSGVASQPVQGMMPGSYAGNYANNAYQNVNPAMQNPYTPNKSQPLQPGAINTGQGSAPARMGKRSFLDTIREWFHL